MRSYKNKRLSKAEAKAFTRQAVDDILPQTAAGVLYILDRRGWHRDRIMKLYSDLVALYRTPPIFGRSLDGDDVRDYITAKYGIDWTELTSAAKIEE